MKVGFFVLLAILAFIVIGTPSPWGIQAQKKNSFDALCQQSSRPGTCDEVLSVITRFWRAAQKDDLDVASKLRTNTMEGFTIVVNDDAHPWESVIFETGLTYIRPTNFECKSETECRVLVVARNRYGNELRLVHTVVKGDDGWRILFIT